MFMKETNVHTYLDTARTFGLLLSAIVHDVDHPGHTNTFEVNTGSELAAIYNDKSVLENHHCSTAFRLMRRNDCGVLTSLSVNDARDVRKAVVAAVLATDMAVHFQMAGEMAQKAPKSGAKLQYDEEGDKLFLCSIFLHAADLSNPYRRFDLTQAWARRVAEEFNNQISREKEMGLPYLPYMETPDEMALCRNEIGFGTHVVMPYVKNLAVLFPELSYIQSNLSDNIEKWKSLLT
jgi:calcium/calmodulin-dependent 3',5'-cyclic nucleotide phosphodiesterase/high affinity cAMP-specific and IBMX-insensitive 3',5'-cyclic phosphodiesterase 8